MVPYGPIWPWADSSTRGLLVEAFPAAQLYHWNLPHNRYNGEIHQGMRVCLVSEISHRLLLLTRYHELMLESADALDAVLCAFAARAAAREEAGPLDGMDCQDEGWIAVHP